MNYLERTDHEQGIIVGEIHNMTTREQFTEVAVCSHRTRIKALQLGYLVLFDFHNSTEIYQSSVIDIFHWRNDYYNETEKDLISIPAAHVLPEIEEAFVNRLTGLWKRNGFVVKLFRDRPSAIEWLNRQKNPRDGLKAAQ